MPRNETDPTEVLEGEGGGRRLLEDLGRALALARALRYEPVDRFVDVDDEDLYRAARSLKAIAYSCQTGARHLERILDRRGDR